jgi:hypothetical protein
LVALVSLVMVCSAHAQDAERDLAEKWAPVLRLKLQEQPCGSGEPYEPIDVDVLFGNVDVAFRGPWDKTSLVQVAPTADDLAEGSSTTTWISRATRFAPAARTRSGRRG